MIFNLGYSFSTAKLLLSFRKPLPRYFLQPLNRAFHPLSSHPGQCLFMTVLLMHKASDSVLSHHQPTMSVGRFCVACRQPLRLIPLQSDLMLLSYFTFQPRVFPFLPQGC